MNCGVDDVNARAGPRYFSHALVFILLESARCAFYGGAEVRRAAGNQRRKRKYEGHIENKQQEARG